MTLHAKKNTVEREFSLDAPRSKKYGRSHHDTRQDRCHLCHRDQHFCARLWTTMLDIGCIMQRVTKMMIACSRRWLKCSLRSWNCTCHVENVSLRICVWSQLDNQRVGADVVGLNELVMAKVVMSLMSLLQLKAKLGLTRWPKGPLLPRPWIDATIS